MNMTAASSLLQMGPDGLRTSFRASENYRVFRPEHFATGELPPTEAILESLQNRPEDHQTGPIRVRAGNKRLRKGSAAALRPTSLLELGYLGQTEEENNGPFDGLFETAKSLFTKSQETSTVIREAGRDWARDVAD